LLQLLLAAVAAVGFARGQQLFDDVLVPVEALRLKEGTFVVIGWMASGVERSRSVSSMRRMNCPAWRRAYSQQKSAVRSPPMCKKPVGLGANRVRTVMDLIGKIGGRRV
jgi:hypothetical protein